MNTCSCLACFHTHTHALIKWLYCFSPKQQLNAFKSGKTQWITLALTYANIPDTASNIAGNCYFTKLTQCLSNSVPTLVAGTINEYIQGSEDFD